MPRPRHKYRALCALAAISSMGLAGLGHARAPQSPTPSPQPSIEALAPTFFGPAAGERETGSVATYRVDAEVLLPLLIVSVPIARREGVGFGHFYTTDHLDADGGLLRTFEFFATSIPERSRGLNRLGFLREAVMVEQDGAAWTAYFGVVSSTREETAEEAERASGSAEDAQRFSVIDGTITQGEAANTVSYVELSGRWTGAEQLYSEVRRRLAGRPSDRAREIRNSEGQEYEEPLAFLGGLQVSLHSVATAIRRGDDARGLQQRYVHDGRILRFELTDADSDPGRGRAYVEAGWASSPSAVWRLSYRVLEPDSEEIEKFKLWVELPPAGGRALADPIIPISFELRPRSFLRLRAERTKSQPPG